MDNRQFAAAGEGEGERGLEREGEMNFGHFEIAKILTRVFCLSKPTV